MGKGKKEVAIYGNYEGYYGYRNKKHSEEITKTIRELKEDPRLKVFKKERFEDKDCIDIGCNNGMITINIAKKFCCRSILGLDIDAGKDSKYNLTSTSTSKRPRTELEGVDGVNNVLHPVTEPSIEQTRGISGYSSPSSLSARVSFQEKNFVQSLCDHKRCDTIICLSVTKWIHLNWGDDGLIDLFAKIWRLLKPGGMLILEPQPWSLYKRKCKVSEINKRELQKYQDLSRKFSEHTFGQDWVQDGRRYW